MVRAAASLNQTAHNYVTHSPYACVRRTVSQENARLTNACGTACTAEDFRRIDQQMARLEAAGNLAEIARHSGLTSEQGQQLAQLALELAPIYSTGESLVQLVSGKSSVSGEEVSRFWAAVGLMPVAGGVLRRTGEPAVNEQGLIHLQDVMHGPGEFIKKDYDNGLSFLEKRLPDGRGVRLNLDGSFKGFLD